MRATARASSHNASGDVQLPLELGGALVHDRADLGFALFGNRLSRVVGRRSAASSNASSLAMTSIVVRRVTSRRASPSHRRSLRSPAQSRLQPPGRAARDRARAEIDAAASTFTIMTTCTIDCAPAPGEVVEKVVPPPSGHEIEKRGGVRGWRGVELVASSTAASEVAE